NFWEIGVGYYEGGGEYYRYWTQDLGRRNDVYPVVINREAAETDSTTVQLYIYGAGTWDEMRLRNDGGTWGAWRTFQTNLTWELASEAGERTVEVEVRSSSKSDTMSDTIRLTKPALGILPDDLSFTYDKLEDSSSPPSVQIIPTNVGNNLVLEWAVTREGSWFTVDPTSGATPDAFTIEPDKSVLATLPAGTYTGAVTVTVTNYAETLNSPHRIDLSVVVKAPKLGGLPDTVTFTHYIPDDLLLIPVRELTPQNVGSDDDLQWTVSATNGWFEVGPASGTTPESFAITVTDYVSSTVGTYTGSVTVNVTDPASTESTPQTLDLVLRVVDDSPERSYLPLIMRNYTAPPPTRYPDDPDYTSQWGLEKVNAPLAWGYSLGDGVLIAVLDSGADLGHPDLAGKLRTDIARSYVDGAPTVQDDNGHGTHVTGIAAAATDNGQGVAGLGWNATVVPLKILDNTGYGEFSNLILALRYATDNGADVINLSLATKKSVGDFYCSHPDFDSLRSAFKYAYDHGVLTVVAAGNDNYDAAKVVPANCPYVLTVGATTSGDERASFSNVGDVLDIAAPGSSIWSTYWPNTYKMDNGTSMATPFVSGLAALVKTRYPHYTPDQLAAAILDNAVDLGSAGRDAEYGCGRIEAANAVIQGTTRSTSACKPHALTGTSLAASEVPALAEPPVGSYVPGRIIAKPRPGLSAQSSLLRAYEVEPEERLFDEVWTLEVPVGQEWETIRRLNAAGLVEYAHLDYYVFAQ
ncbi:MAG: S8 family serine peptidase, partial [Anaerolineales bacterium]